MTEVHLTHEEKRAILRFYINHCSNVMVDYLFKNTSISRSFYCIVSQYIPKEEVNHNFKMRHWKSFRTATNNEIKRNFPELKGFEIPDVFVHQCYDYFCKTDPKMILETL